VGRVGLLIGCLGALILLLLIVGGWYVGVRNHLVDLDQQVQSQWAQVENDYQRRFDLIPNLVRTVQGAANFEKSTLEAVVNARSRVGQVQMPAGGPPGAQSNLPNDPNAMAQFAAAQENLSGALSRLLVVVERYPDLKSNQNFLELQSQLEGTENRIAVERKRYNDVAQTYNASVLKFPANLVANMSGFKPKAYFRGVQGSAQPPEVNFNFGNAPAPAPAPATGTR
jgi:LemA protein